MSLSTPPMKHSLLNQVNDKCSCFLDCWSESKLHVIVSVVCTDKVQAVKVESVIIIIYNI